MTWRLPIYFFLITIILYSISYYTNLDSNIKTLDEDGKEDSKEQDSGTSLQVTEEEVKHDNFMSQLADWHIVLIMLSIALLASAATALIVYSYVLRRRREVFDNFLKKLPSSGGEDDTFVSYITIFDTCIILLLRLMS